MKLVSYNIVNQKGKPYVSVDFGGEKKVRQSCRDPAEAFSLACASLAAFSDLNCTTMVVTLDLRAT
jgi:hypothetical protein